MAGGQSWAPSESLAQTTSGYDLRPLSTGEVLDRTFQLYRSRFALFASLAALPAGVSFLSGALQVLFTMGERRLRNGIQIQTVTRPVLYGVIVTIGVLLYFACYGITQAATTWAVAEIYLGKPASVGAAWKAATTRWFRYVLVTLRQYWSLAWWFLLSLSMFFAVLALVPRIGGGSAIAVGILSFVFGLQIFASAIYAVYAAIRVSLAVPASVIESLGPNAAVRRSMTLLTQRKGRIFLLGLLLLAMSMVVGVLLTPLAFIGLRAHGPERYILQMIQLGGAFLSRLLVGPVGAIALCLFYFDERVRHEGFDIEFLMLRAGPPPGDPPAEPNPSPEPA
ncbi:MAG TPA: hypothetical protein VHE33_07815 [Acidobacteriaceae bacterium]|nr:hypothetical protein [Acidobacteriaceae bacterium]